MAWRELSQDEQRAHRLYGFGGWLIPVFVVMLGLSILFLVLTVQPTVIEWAIAEYGEQLGREFIERFHIWSIAATAVWGLLLWMAMRPIRTFPYAALLLMWPLLLWSNALNIPLIGVAQTLLNFCFWAIVPIAISIYLIVGERVNVTYRQRTLQTKQQPG